MYGMPRASISWRSQLARCFNAHGRYVLVNGMPSTARQDYGERSFSREATERARLLEHDPQKDAPAQSVPMQVYDFA